MEKEKQIKEKTCDETMLKHCGAEEYVLLNGTSLGIYWNLQFSLSKPQLLNRFALWKSELEASKKNLGRKKETKHAREPFQGIIEFGNMCFQLGPI